LKDLPPNVHAKHGRYFLVRQSQGVRTWLPLTLEIEGRAALERALTTSRDREPDPETISDLFDAFIDRGLGDLAPVTAKAYEYHIEHRLRYAFGQIKIGLLTPGAVAKYLKARSREGASVSANRERSTLMAAYAFALSEGWADDNPCHRVPRLKERPRTRYVTTEELQAALDASPPHMQELLAAAYYTGLRQGDLRALTRGSLFADGIRLTESKTNRARVISWSPALRGVIERALSRVDALSTKRGQAPNVDTRVFTNRFGKPLSEWAIHSHIRRLREQGVMVGWHFHDLRGKAATDASHPVLGRHSKIGVYLRGERTQPTL
jgi:integrase